MIGYFEALEHILQRYANTTICVERMLCHYDTYVHFFIGPLVFNFQSRKSTALSLERLFQGRIREEKKKDSGWSWKSEFTYLFSPITVCHTNDIIHAKLKVELLDRVPWLYDMRANTCVTYCMDPTPHQCNLLCGLLTFLWVPKFIVWGSRSKHSTWRDCYVRVSQSGYTVSSFASFILNRCPIYVHVKMQALQSRHASS